MVKVPDIPVVSAKLTRENLETLRGFFPLEDHEFHPYTKFVYITEAAITNRIEEIDPAWQMRHIETRQRVNSQTVNKKGDPEPITVITVTVEIEIKGCKRIGVGSATVGLTKNKTGEANDAEKAAATDALKRAARMFGVGRYLLSLKGVDNSAKLKTWLNRRGADSPVENGKPDNVFSKATEQKPETMSKTRLENVNAIAFMYPDDNDGAFHRNGTLNKLIKDGVIEDTTGLNKVIWEVLFYRAQKDFGYSREFFEAEIIGQPVTEFIAEKGTPQQAWNLIQTHKPE